MRRDGRRKVLALDSTDEAGEREPTGPRGGKRDVGLKTRCWELRRGPRTLSTVLTKQQRIAELAKQSPAMAFTSLAYHMDVE